MDEHRFGPLRPARGQGPRRLRLRVVAAAVLAASLPACDVWEQVGQGAGNNRYNPDEAAITPATAGSLAEAWSAHVDGSFSEPILSGGRLYTTVVSGGAATVRAYRADTGAVAWSTPVPGPASPGAPGPVTMVGGALWVSRAGSGASYCSAQLTRLDPATGAVLSTETTGPALTGPVVADGATVAFTTLGHCSQTGNRSELVVRDVAAPAAGWTHRFDLPVGIPVSPPAMGEGLVAVVAEDTLYAFDAGGCGAPTCPPRWTASLALGETPVRAYDRPVVGPDGTVYVGGEAQGLETLVQAFDPATGARRWRTDLHAGGGSSWQALALADGRLYVSDHRYDGRGGAVEVFSAAGCGQDVCAPAWSATVDGPPVAGLTVGGDVLHLGLYGDRGSRFVAFDARGCGAATCPALGDVGFGGEQPVRAAVAGGRVAVVAAGATGAAGETLRVLVPS